MRAGRVSENAAQGKPNVSDCSPAVDGPARAIGGAREIGLPKGRVDMP
jgi:hypothetical protein